MPGLNNWTKFNNEVKGATCSFDFSELEILSKKQCIDHAVHEIHKRYDNLYVAISGGIDSEFVAKCFHERHIKFTPIIVDFILNSAEVWYAYKWCYDNNIKPHVIKLSIHDMMQVLPEIAIRHNTAYISAIDFIMIDYVNSVNGSLIHSNVNPFDKLDCFSDTLEIALNQNLEICSFDFMPDVFYSNHPFNFISYTPELFYNIISSVDYSLPAQVALSSYYGVSARPKIPFMHAIGLDPTLTDLCRSVNSNIPIWSFDLGHKDEFLARSLKSQTLDFTTNLRKKGMKCQKL